MVTNNSFVDQIAFDGMRKHLLRDFSRVHHLHLEGNVRQNPKLSGTAYNVFGIQVGVSISLFIRLPLKKGAQRKVKTLPAPCSHQPAPLFCWRLPSWRWLTGGLTRIHRNT